MESLLYDQTIINPIALLFSIIMFILVLTIRKEYVIIPVILISCLITGMQRITLFSVDFTMLRICIVLGIFRFLIMSKKSLFVINKIDKLMIFYSIIRIFVYVIQWKSIGAFVYILGEIFDILGCYFLVRVVIDDIHGVEIAIKTLIIVSIPIAFFMIFEQLSGGRNLFSAFGGVPELSFIRNGRLRAQGAFSHPIMAGTFGAMLFPLSWGIWYRNKKFIAIIGFLCSLIITYSSSSSGPVFTLGTAIFGLGFWLFRNYTIMIFKWFLLVVIILHLTMNAPVWHLISRVNLVGGSTGFHRFLLIDAAIHNFFSWFLVGLKDTGVWGHGLQDITCQYIVEGVRGGIVVLLLFLIIIKNCFQLIGSIRLKLYEQLDIQKLIWSLGALLFAHVVTFISVSYFGTLVFFYYMLIAMISSMSYLLYCPEYD